MKTRRKQIDEMFRFFTDREFRAEYTAAAEQQRSRWRTFFIVLLWLLAAYTAVYVYVDFTRR